ncbi:MAG: hypothetical protein COB88_09025, partial [Flavobacteriales bacterium]
HNIIVADAAQAGPLSRKADPDDWEAALKTAIDARLGRYEGDKYFHIGTHVDAYVLAIPGVPLVATPKSVLIISVNASATNNFGFAIHLLILPYPFALR